MSIRSLGTAVVALLTAMTMLAAPGFAFDGNGGGSDNGGSGQHAGDGSESGSSGEPVYHSVGGCALYANSSTFGMYCFTGGGGDGVQTVGQILGHDEAPQCWDEAIARKDLKPLYGIADNPASAYYVNYCITGLTLANSPYYQPGVQLNPTVIEVPIHTPNCDVARKGKDKAAVVFTPTDDMYSCVEWLTHNQQEVVDKLKNASGVGHIPDMKLVTHPTRKIRTNEYVAYVEPVGYRTTRTPEYTSGNVTMWATMDRFSIFPYGPSGEQKVCNGTGPITDQDSPQTIPDACWWKYPQSSGDQPRDRYPFRAQADWTVWDKVGNGAPEVFATFHKYLDKPLPVYDVQSIVIH